MSYKVSAVVYSGVFIYMEYYILLFFFFFLKQVYNLLYTVSSISFWTGTITILPPSAIQ